MARKRWRWAVETFGNVNRFIGEKVQQFQMFRANKSIRVNYCSTWFIKKSHFCPDWKKCPTFATGWRWCWCWSSDETFTFRRIRCCHLPIKSRTDFLSRNRNFVLPNSSFPFRRRWRQKVVRNTEPPNSESFRSRFFFLRRRRRRRRRRQEISLRLGADLFFSFAPFFLRAPSPSRRCRWFSRRRRKIERSMEPRFAVEEITSFLRRKLGTRE